LEELLLKDNENVSDIEPGPTQDAPLKSFTPDEMVRCESCLRANPPTRVSCLYCGHPLPVTRGMVQLQQPALRPLEKWEQGYNNILPAFTANADIPLSEVARLARLTEEELQRIIAAGCAMPLARSGSEAEAQLIQQRLASMGISSLIVADEVLGAVPSIKLRAADFYEDSFDAYQTRDAAPLKIFWDDLRLMVAGRIMRRRVELTEERKRNEKKVIEADQFFADENVIEVFAKKSSAPYRIMSGSFDFSCLGANKRLLAGENISVLVNVFLQRAPTIVYDETYNSIRKGLDPVWKADQQNDSTGWRRARPGKYSLGSANQTSNESQFTRYARLRYYLLTNELKTGANG
jgi:hypothetical protein